MKNNGKELELLINLIQKHIEPDAVVEHDVHLPVIGSASGRTRQCDIVITSGPKHRKTITIIEAQDRTSQVEINTFNGWLGKLDEIGAQHLICVSRLEYPESIKEKAISLGNKVKLINLKDADPTEIPISFLKSNFKYCNYQPSEIIAPKIIFTKAEAVSLGIFESINKFIETNKVDANSMIFSYDKHELKSIYTICQDSCENLSVNGSGSQILEFNKVDDPPLFFHIDGHFTRIGMRLEFKWKNEVIEYPVSLMSYEQQTDGSLAWIMEGKYDTPSGHLSFKVPLIRKENYHEIPGMIINMPMNNELILQIVNVNEVKE
jgi:hypothetical protein